MRSISLLAAVSLAVLIYGCSDDESGQANLPDAIPTFTGAERVPDSGFSEEDAFSATWRTSQDVPAVREYFERALDNEGAWQIVETREIENGVVIRVEDPEDPASGGTIIVREEGGSTRIGETIGRDNDEDHEEADNSDDPGEVTSNELPQGYPSDVPLPADAEIVSGIAPLVESSQYYLVEFKTGSSPSELIAYFNDELSSQGWETGASADDSGAFVLNFSRGDDSVTVTGGGTESGTSASITIIIEG